MLDRHRTFWARVLVGWLMISLSFILNYYFFAEHYVESSSSCPRSARFWSGSSLNGCCGRGWRL